MDADTKQRLLLARQIQLLLQDLNLLQQPPHIRCVLRRDGSPLRLAFPWVSIGRLPSSVHRFEDEPFVYFHNRKWETLEEAVGLLRLPPAFFHLVGYLGAVCIGEAILDLDNGLITPAEAFWHTRNIYSRNHLPKAMLECDLDGILSVRWRKPHWRKAEGLPYPYGFGLVTFEVGHE